LPIEALSVEKSVDVTVKVEPVNDEYGTATCTPASVKTRRLPDVGVLFGIALTSIEVVVAEVSAVVATVI
jgi:hypothetical protein